MRLPGFLKRGDRRGPTDDEPEGEGPIDLNDPFPTPVVIPFQDVLDLHAIPPRQVKAVIEDYLLEAHRRRVRWIRLIHGKGIGAQREMVRVILSRTAFVADYRDAPSDAGGWGATIVTLSTDD